MGPSNAKVTTRNLALGFSALVMGAVIVATSGLFRAREKSQPSTVAVQSNPEYQQATAAIYGRLQLLPELERQMLANAASPVRVEIYRRRRADARHRIDQLIATARSAAVSDTQIKQVAHLSEMAARADARYEQMLARTAQRQQGMPVAVSTN